MKILKKKDLYILKAAIKGFAAEARRIRRKEILPNTHEAKYRGWAHKRILGEHARIYQLAYALLLGRKYSSLEKGKPLAKEGWLTRNIITKVLNVCKIYGGWRAQKCLTEETIKIWFKTDENVFAKAPKKISVMFNIPKRETSQNGG